jgi:predicted CoA-binding protein
MRSDYEEFWDHGSFAVVGDSSKRRFPRLTYSGLKALGRTVYAVDPGAEQIEGDPAFPSLRALPGPVEAAVLELPAEETREWVRRVADAGITELWIHQRTETPEAVAEAEERGIQVLTGTSAVMYLSRGFSRHTLRRWAAKIAGRY